MKYSKIEVLTVKEVEDRLVEERANLRKLKFSHAISPIENPSKIPESKRLIAKLMTNLRSREIQNRSITK